MSEDAMECPRCGNDELDRDSVDVGVGVIHGPWGCPNCGWSENSEYDLSDGRDPVDEKGGAIDQYGGYHPPGSSMAEAYRLAREDEKAGKVAYYFGYGPGGHFLRDRNMQTVYPEEIPGFPWKGWHLDSGLLNNGKVKDEETGIVYWTCGGDPLWLGFFWWDRSGDTRPNSNSGFYVRGFDHIRPERGLAYACEVFPGIVKRQTRPLRFPELVLPGDQPVIASIGDR